MNIIYLTGFRVICLSCLTYCNIKILQILKGLASFLSKEIVLCEVGLIYFRTKAKSRCDENYPLIFPYHLSTITGP